MSKDLMFDPELRDGLRAGSAAVRRTVEANFGPVGRNTIREQSYDLPLVANTGRRVLQDLSLKDPVENLAAVLVRDAALEVAGTCGDGSIATAVLTDSLISEGHRLVAAGFDPMGLRRGVHRALPVAKACLDGIAVPFSQIDTRRFAAATAKNDEVAENVAKAFELVGVDGVITVQDTQGRETVLNLWDGARYDYGLFSMAFANDDEHKRAVLDEPFVLLSNRKIGSLQDIRKILEQVIRTGASLLIIASDMTDDLQKLLAANAARGLKVAVAKAPGHGDARRRNMLALAAKIGSLMFDDNTGREMKDCGLEVCSRIGRAEVDREATVLQGFRDSSGEMVEILLRHTRTRLAETTDPDEREKLLLTLSILNGRTAEILAGAVVEYEMFEKKYLYENTIRAIQSAARSGLVPGAGNAYLAAADAIRRECAGWPEAESIGARCLADALRGLTKALSDNAGRDGAVVLDMLAGRTDPYQGFDVLSGRIVDLKEAGILTPKSTVWASISVAAETAASVWTTGAAVIEH